MALADLINFNIDTASQFIDLAGAAVAEIAVPHATVGYSVLGIDPNNFNANYEAPPDDTTPFPVYQPPTLAIPATPNLVALHGINPPALPATPTVVTAGLFDTPLPTNPIPQFTEPDIDLHADEIYHAIVAVAEPVLAEIILPTITPLAIGAVPQVTIPGYAPYPILGEIQAPDDYAGYYQAQYDNASPVMRGLVDDMMDSFIQKYAPDYPTVRTQLSEAIQSGLAGNSLPTAYDDALFSRHQARVNKESARAELSILNDPGYRGWIVPPGKQQAAIDSLAIESARNLAGASTEAFIEIRRAAIQSYQFVLNMADNQLTGIRGQVLQFSSTGLAIIGASTAQAQNLANLLVTKFEHERSRHEFSLAIMKAIDEQFKIKLDAALSVMVAYEAELKALGLKADIEGKQMDAARIQVDVQRTQVQLYSAIVDAIAKRTVGDELKIKEMALKVSVFDTQIKAVLAAYDAYKAANDGDKSKLEGELSKLELFKAQLQGVNLQLDAQKAIQQGDIAFNEAQLGQFGTQLGAYETSAKIALQRFTAEAEQKKLGVDVFKVKSDVALSLYEGQLKEDIAFNGAITEAFRGNVSSRSNYYQLLKSYSELQLNAQSAIASGYTNVASAAIQANSAVLSLSGTE